MHFCFFSCCTACATNEFRCDDGICIDETYHCDDIPDCIDKSDENECDDVNNGMYVQLQI